MVQSSNSSYGYCRLWRPHGKHPRAEMTYRPRTGKGLLGRPNRDVGGCTQDARRHDCLLRLLRQTACWAMANRSAVRHKLPVRSARARRPVGSFGDCTHSMTEKAYGAKLRRNTPAESAGRQDAAAQKGGKHGAKSADAKKVPSAGGAETYGGLCCGRIPHAQMIIGNSFPKLNTHFRGGEHFLEFGNQSSCLCVTTT